MNKKYYLLIIIPLLLLFFTRPSKSAIDCELINKAEYCNILNAE